MKSQAPKNKSNTGKTLTYNWVNYASDKVKASALVQEHSTIIGRKSDKPVRRAVRELQ